MSAPGSVGRNSQPEKNEEGLAITMNEDEVDGQAVAIIGMAGRFPGANSVNALWENLCNGVESITSFTDEELDPSISADLRNDPAYVRARGVLPDAECFDAAFFGVSPREAQMLDPQQRVFLEVAWEALEDAGIDPDAFDGPIGVFGGAGYNTYFLNHVLANRKQFHALGEHQAMLANSPDYLATRVSYKLNLKGPSISLYTGCSSSLVAVSSAFDSLLTYQSDVALAGGVFVWCPQNNGYLYQPGEIFSADGHCRPFDSRANGTVFSNGAGIVVLKRLEDALQDNDPIYAVIKGTGVNNDGSLKTSFTAPSVDAQAAAVAMAIANADVRPDTIGYIEAHGTGTIIGDPIEVEALTRAFRAGTEAKGFCAIGSIKANLGHLDAAAGVAGLIKVALMLKHKRMVPSINYLQANPEINFPDSPFYVGTELKDWPQAPHPRRAGVTSLGVGGTNVHLLLEEGPQKELPGPSRPLQLLLLSAKTKKAVGAVADKLKGHLQDYPEANLADIAYTLQTARKKFSSGGFAVCSGIADAVGVLEAATAPRMVQRETMMSPPDVMFMFPGQGSQYLKMGQDLYRQEKIFRDALDHCANLLKEHLQADLRDILFATGSGSEDAEATLRKTCYQQPALFSIGYALAELWKSWGVKPTAMIGHSIGEYVAACLAGVFSLEDALRLVAARGRMMQEMPAGSMLSVRLPAAQVEELIAEPLSLAAVNAPSLCVVSGPTADIQRLQKQLEEQDIGCAFLHTSHAFHSAMMDPIVTPFSELVLTVPLSPPKIPYVSTATGTWVTDDQATDPTFWGRQLRGAVLFADGINTLLKSTTCVLLELGPRNTATTLAKQQISDLNRQIAVPSLGSTDEAHAELAAMLHAVGHLWAAGVAIDWNAFYREENRIRTWLPGYPFERRRHWLEAPVADEATLSAAEQRSGLSDEAESADERVAEVAVGNSLDPQRQTVARKLATVWQELLGVDEIELDDNFFDLGGDSLMAAGLRAQINKAFDKSMDADDLVSASTFGAMVDFIYDGTTAEDHLETDSPYSIVSVPPEECRDDILALWERNFPSLKSERFDWIYQANPDGPAICLLVKHAATAQVVGVHGVFPRRFYIKGKPCMGVLGGDLAIDKEHRTLAPAVQLQKAVLALSASDTFSLYYGFPNKNSQAVNQMLGLTMLDVYRLVKPLKSYEYIEKRIHTQVVSQALSKVVDSVFKGLSKESRYKRSGQYLAELTSGFDERFDLLWQTVAGRFAIIAERSSRYLQWRYMRSPHHHHQVFVLADKSDDSLCGYIVFHTEDNRSYIDDMLSLNLDEAFDILMSEFLLIQRDKGVASVSVNFAGMRLVREKLTDFGFSVRDAEDKVTVFTEPAHKDQALVLDNDSWYLMPGDKDI